MTSRDTIAEALRRAVGSLTSRSTSPRLDAELLLGKVLGVQRSELIVRGEEPLDEAHRATYLSLLERRLEGAPVAYLTGMREFWSLPLKVTPAVLVPRPETELLVELALARLPVDEARSVVDLGTGSGAIALALATERPRCRITGIDISPAALGVAEDNARHLGLPQISWKLGSWFDAIESECFDLIVANPPYVAAGDPARARLSAEPELALCGGLSGLEALEAIVAGAARHLPPTGSLLVEHGHDQACAVAQLFERYAFLDIELHVDYAGLPRVTLGSLHSSH
jgi:release factor glutamine methyltransferase